MQPGQDFPAKSHPIHFFFGLNEFVTLTPNAPKEKEDLGSETRAKVTQTFFVVDGFDQHFRATVHFPLTSAFDLPQQHQ